MLTLAQWIARLTKAFIKFTGKKPDKLAKLKIKMEAGQKVKDQEKVIKVDFDPENRWITKGEKTVIETEAEIKSKLDKLLGPGDDVFGSPIKDWHMEKFKKPGAKDVTPIKKTKKSIDLSKYDDASLNALVNEDTKLLAEANKLSEAGTNYGRVKAIEVRRKEIKEILEAAQDVPASGYDNFKADIAAKKQTDAQIKAKLEKQNKEAIERLKKKREKEIMDDMKEFEDPEDLAYGGLAGMLGEPTYADGGRTGFKKGTKFDPKRRGFLKLAAGLASIPLIGKYFKWAKPLAKSSKVLTSVPIGNAPGMPVWFKPLVNKVIKEGDDVTKKLATKEREIVHTKKLGDPKDKFADEITVTQDLETGNVRVEYDTVHNMGEAPIQLDYKAGQIIEEGSKKGTKTKAEFSAVESEPRITNWDGDIEWDGENIVSKVDDLFTDTTKLESYATGKNPTIKKLLKSEQKKKYVNKLHDDTMEQVEYIENKGGEYMPVEDILDEGKRVGDFDPKGYDRYNEWKGQNLPERKIKKASGGRVPLSGGGGPDKLEEAIRAYRKYQGSRKNPRLNFKTFFEIYAKENFATGGRVPLKKGKVPKGPNEWLQLLEIDWDDMDPDEWVGILRSLGVKGHATGGRVPFGVGELVKPRNWKLFKEFVERLFIKSSNQIRRGEGPFKGLNEKQRIVQHDNLTKLSEKFRKTGEFDKGANQYFGIDAEKEFAKVEARVKKQSTADEITEGVADVMKDTSEAGLARSIEVDNLKLEFPGITDDMINNILIDKNPQRIAEVKATMKEAMKMQQKGMGHEEIMKAFRDSWGRKKNATGGRVSLSSGGLAGMLGE